MRLAKAVPLFCFTCMEANHPFYWEGGGIVYKVIQAAADNPHLDCPLPPSGGELGNPPGSARPPCVGDKAV